MSKRRLVIVLVAVLAIGAFGAWEVYAQGPRGNDAPPCGEFYGPGMMGGWDGRAPMGGRGMWGGPGMMRGHMMGGWDGWNMPEDCPYADEMWGTGAADSVELTLTEDEALAAAQAYLDENYPGLTVDDVVATYNGYYMLHILEDGQLVGMLSVNGETGEVWLHHRPWSTDRRGM